MYTEAQMKEFFQGLIDQVATLSSQAARVEGLEARIADLTQRVNDLAVQNHNLQEQVDEGKRTVNALNADVIRYQTDLDNERAITGGLRDTIVQRDTRVTELQTQHANVVEAHTAVTRERDEARNTVNDLNVLVDELRRKLTAAQEDATHWHSAANRLEGEVTSMQVQFERLRGILSPPVVPSADVA